MSRPKLLYDDVREICIQMARGYDRRVFNRDNNLEMAPFDPIAIEAVEEAQQVVGLGLSEDDRHELIDAIMSSCALDRYSFKKEVQLDAKTRPAFYRQRNLFLQQIALYLQLV